MSGLATAAFTTDPLFVITSDRMRFFCMVPPTSGVTKSSRMGLFLRRAWASIFGSLLSPVLVP
eukprot:10180416-Karenia_brevis.AAC.1